MRRARALLQVLAGSARFTVAVGRWLPCPYRCREGLCCLAWGSLSSAAPSCVPLLVASMSALLGLVCFHILEEATQWPVGGDGRRLRATTAVGTSAYWLAGKFSFGDIYNSADSICWKSCHCQHLNWQRAQFLLDKIARLVGLYWEKKPVQISRPGGPVHSRYTAKSRHCAD